MKLKTRFAPVGCLTLLIIIQAWSHVGAQESSEPRTVHSKTQHGITVRLEKITVERIINGPAWIKAERNASRIGDDVDLGLRQHLPARLVTCFVSVVGDTRTLGPTKIDFATEGKTVRSVDRFFSPPKWQPRLPKLAVDPKASGIETQHLLNGETRISDVFPAEIKVQVTTAEGKKLIFKFQHVEF